MVDIRATITRPNQIVADISGIAKTQSNPPIELKNNVPSINQQYLSKLLDVDVSSPVDGQVLTYNAVTGKYDLEPVDVGDISLDGGTF